MTFSFFFSSWYWDRFRNSILENGKNLNGNILEAIAIAWTAANVEVRDRILLRGISHAWSIEDLRWLQDAASWDRTRKALLDQYLRRGRFDRLHAGLPTDRGRCPGRGPAIRSGVWAGRPEASQGPRRVLPMHGLECTGIAGP